MKPAPSATRCRVRRGQKRGKGMHASPDLSTSARALASASRRRPVSDSLHFACLYLSSTAVRRVARAPSITTISSGDVSALRHAGTPSGAESSTLQREQAPREGAKSTEYWGSRACGPHGPST